MSCHHVCFVVHVLLPDDKLSQQQAVRMFNKRSVVSFELSIININALMKAELGIYGL